MSIDKKSPTTIDRRSFLLELVKVSGQITVASTVIYSVSLFEKGKFGGMTAGAKDCPNADGSLLYPPGTVTDICTAQFSPGDGPTNINQQVTCQASGAWRNTGARPPFISWCP
ncbi:MAG: hypothetical protein WA160_15705 [Pseudobdellovibrio sp.]